MTVNNSIQNVNWNEEWRSRQKQVKFNLSGSHMNHVILDVFISRRYQYADGKEMYEGAKSPW